MTAAQIIEERRRIESAAYELKRTAPELESISIVTTRSRSSAACITDNGNLELRISDSQGNVGVYQFGLSEAIVLGKFISKYWPAETKALK